MNKTLLVLNTFNEHNVTEVQNKLAENLTGLKKMSITRTGSTAEPFPAVKEKKNMEFCIVSHS